MSLDNQVLFTINGGGDASAQLLVSNTLTLVAAIACIGLRFTSRRISKTPLSWDDWLTIPALFLALLYYGNLCYTIGQGGFGRYIGDVTFAKLRQAFLGIFIGELFYAYGLVVAKCSILALYLRLFDQKWARLYCYTLISTQLLWALTCTILACLQCQPTAGFWDKEIQATCTLNIKHTYLGLGLVTIVTDVAMIILPTVTCWKLNLNLTKKLLLCGVFATGLFVTIVSAVRVKAILDLDTSDSINAVNITWTFVDVAMWSGVELNMAIVSGCLPVLRPLVAKMIPETLVPATLRKRSYISSYVNSQGAYSSVLDSRKYSEAVIVTKPPQAAVVDLEAQRQQRRELASKEETPQMSARLTRPPSWSNPVPFGITPQTRGETTRHSPPQITSEREAATNMRW